MCPEGFQILCKFWSSSSVWERSPFSDLMLKALKQLAFLWLGPKSIPWALGWRAEGLPYTQRVTTCPSAELPELRPLWALSSRYCKEVGLGSSDAVWAVWGIFSSPDSFLEMYSPATLWGCLRRRKFSRHLCEIARRFFLLIVSKNVKDIIFKKSSFSSSRPKYGFSWSSVVVHALLLYIYNKDLSQRCGPEWEEANLSCTLLGMFVATVFSEGSG